MIRFHVLYLIVVVLILVLPAEYAEAVVLDFDDLTSPMSLTREGYAGLTWEYGNIGRGGIYQGEWILGSDWPYSGSHNVLNAFGATLMGINFPTAVDVASAYFAGQGAEIGWTSGIRVHGYKDGLLVDTTDWFNDIDSNPDWFAINLTNVDRIVVESVPVYENGGYYNMDDFTYTPAPEPGTILLLGLGSITLLKKRKLR